MIDDDVNGSLITVNGVENINKQFYTQVINNHIKKLFPQREEILKKFSFPSYTTHNGSKTVTAIKQFKQKDLDIDNLNQATKLRYRKVAINLLKNHFEYQRYIDMHLFQKEHIAVVNNHCYYSILAHGLAVQLEYIELLGIIEEICPALLKNKTKTLSFFLTTPHLDKIIKAPEHLNHYRNVNNNYKQLYLALSHSKNYSHITPVFIEIDLSDMAHMTKTSNLIKESVSRFLA